MSASHTGSRGVTWGSHAMCARLLDRELHVRLDAQHKGGLHAPRRVRHEAVHAVRLRVNGHADLRAPPHSGAHSSQPRAAGQGVGGARTTPKPRGRHRAGSSAPPPTPTP
eukprot:208706-Prymnesium_polylepis.1